MKGHVSTDNDKWAILTVAAPWHLQQPRSRALDRIAVDATAAGDGPRMVAIPRVLIGLRLTWRAWDLVCRLAGWLASSDRYAHPMLIDGVGTLRTDRGSSGSGPRGYQLAGNTWCGRSAVATSASASQRAAGDAMLALGGTTTPPARPRSTSTASFAIGSLLDGQATCEPPDGLAVGRPGDD